MPLPLEQFEWYIRKCRLAHIEHVKDRGSIERVYLHRKLARVTSTPPPNYLVRPSWLQRMIETYPEGTSIYETMKMWGTRSDEADEEILEVIFCINQAMFNARTDPNQPELEATFEDPAPLSKHPKKKTRKEKEKRVVEEEVVEVAAVVDEAEQADDEDDLPPVPSSSKSRTTPAKRKNVIEDSDGEEVSAPHSTKKAKRRSTSEALTEDGSPGVHTDTDVEPSEAPHCKASVEESSLGSAPVLPVLVKDVGQPKGKGKEKEVEQVFETSLPTEVPGAMEGVEVASVSNNAGVSNAVPPKKAPPKSKKKAAQPNTMTDPPKPRKKAAPTTIRVPPRAGVRKSTRGLGKLNMAGSEELEVSPGGGVGEGPLEE